MFAVLGGRSTSFLHCSARAVLTPPGAPLGAPSADREARSLIFNLETFWLREPQNFGPAGTPLPLRCIADCILRRLDCYLSPGAPDGYLLQSNSRSPIDCTR
jgi:hypothetical protein